MGTYIAWGIVLFIIFLLFLKISIWIILENENISLRVKVLCFCIDLTKFLLSDEEKTPKSKKTPKKKKEKQEKKEESSVRKSLADWMFLLDEYVEKVKKVLRNFTKKIKIDRLSITVAFSTGDAAKTAIAGGMANAFLYPLIGRMDAAFIIKERQITVSPDFSEKTYFQGRFEAIVGMRSISGLVIAMKALFYLFIQDKLIKKSKGGAKF